MTNEFEFFEGAATESNASPRITVRRGGHLVLTHAAVEQLGAGVTFVQLGFNAKTGAVGIRAADEAARGRYRLRRQKSALGHIVDAKRFFRHHDLPLGKARSFEVEDFGGGIVGFRLDTQAAVEVVEPAVEQAPETTPSIA
ncbi:MAG: hypothetical protein HC897_03760, partial [Thermoanaerobaculia bacterium]|nr:hypothetical protein [Thermoanaerobaculia bacterium]